MDIKIEDIKYIILDKASLSGLYPEDCLGSHTVNLNDGGGYKPISVNIEKNDIEDYLAKKANYHYCLT